MMRTVPRLTFLIWHRNLYPGPDVHAYVGRAGVSSTGSVGVSDLSARTSVTRTSVTNLMAKASSSGDHGQRDL